MWRATAAGSSTMTCSRSAAFSPSVAVDEARICSKYGRGFGPGQHHLERLLGVGRIEQDAQQVEDFLGRADAAREHHDAMREAHEGLEALFDVRHDHELVDDGIRRLGGDDAGLGEADVAAADDALLGMADGRALHRALHRARAAAGADIEAAQAQLVAHLLGVLVLLGADRVAAPADDQVRLGLAVEHPRIAQDVEHRVGDRRRVVAGRSGRSR